MKSIPAVLLFATALFSVSGTAGTVGSRTGEPSSAWKAGFYPSTFKAVPTFEPQPEQPVGIRRVEGLRGEWVSFQIVILSDDPVSGINLIPCDLEDHDGNVIPASAVSLFREWFLDVKETSGGGWAVTNHLREPGLYPDPLIPFFDPYSDERIPVAAPFDLTADDPGMAVVWVDIEIPRDIPHGSYFGGIVVTGDSMRQIAVQYQLDVWELDMPAERTVATAFSLSEGGIRMYHGGPSDDQSADYPEIVRNYYKALHQHRMDTTYARGPVSFEFDTEGSLLPVDWTAYDQFMQPRIDGSWFDDTVGITRFAAGMFEPGGGTGTWSEDQYKAAAKAFVEHLDDKGWLQHMWTYSTDEPWLNGGEETWNRVIHDAGLLHESSPLWKGKVLVTGPMYAGAENVVDIWCPVNGMYDKWFWFDMDYAGRGDYDEHMANGGELWFYNCNGNFPPYPGYDIDTTIGYEPRILKWGSFFEKASGFLHWSVNIWHYVEPWTEWQSREVFGELFARNGDGMLIYPGDSNGTRGAAATTPSWLHIDGPVVSYRVKQIRDGLEDWEIFNLAKKAGIGDWLQTELSKAYTRFGDFFVEDCTQTYHYCPAAGEPWTLDPAVMQDVRERVIKKLLFTLYPDRYADPDLVIQPESVESIEYVEHVEDGPDAATSQDAAPGSDLVDSDADSGQVDLIVDTVIDDRGMADEDSSGKNTAGGCASSETGSASAALMMLAAAFALLIMFRRRRI